MLQVDTSHTRTIKNVITLHRSWLVGELSLTACKLVDQVALFPSLGRRPEFERALATQGSQEII